MKVLGVAGGHKRIDEDSGPRTGIYSHDGAAVLVDDGVVIAACEQERVDRIKHSDKAPIEAIQRTLELADIDMNGIDRIAYYASEEGLDRALKMARVRAGEGAGRGARSLVAQLIGDGLGTKIDEQKIDFVKHHVAHAASAFWMSGQDDALIVTIDGIGEDESGLIATGHGSAIEVRRSIAPEASLGQFYCNVIAFLGYGLFDEYKVMGLAPFGDPARFSDLFATFYSLEPEGEYRLHSERILALADLGPPRRRGEPFTQLHKDIAAALQRALSACIFHMIAHARAATGLRNLCLAGGVAHNCTVNGELLRSRLFDDIFVQPAAHDAGCALGAALVVHARSRPVRTSRLDHVYWGTATHADDARAAATRWSRFVTATPRTDIVAHAAERMAAGDVIGWVQGRAEFGPRALGNRSILADPRPARNKEVINAMVKKREGYRPFAPSVTIEDASRWFEVDAGQAFPFMNFVVGVRAEHRETLGAVTHVDGSARIQTVSREQNPRYWELLRAFQAITGVPVLLNK